MCRPPASFHEASCWHLENKGMVAILLMVS